MTIFPRTQMTHVKSSRLYDAYCTSVYVCNTRVCVRARARGLRAVSVWKCEGSLRAEDLLAAGTYRGRCVKPLINYDRTIVAAAVVALLPLFHRRGILRPGEML